MTESFFSAIPTTFAGKKTTRRRDIVPPFIRERARERYSTIRESMFPLEEAAKQIVYIDTLIYLLDEQGFEFKQGIEGNHRVVDKIGRKEFEVCILDSEDDEEEEENEFVYEGKKKRNIGTNEKDVTRRKMTMDRRRSRRRNVVDNERRNGDVAIRRKKRVVSEESELGSRKRNHRVIRKREMDDEREAEKRSIKRERGKRDLEELERIKELPNSKTRGKMIRTGSSKWARGVNGPKKLHSTKVRNERNQDDQLISGRNAQDHVNVEESEIFRIPQDKMPVVVVPTVPKKKKATYVRF
ncbi:14503_t:CDS:2 [Acaulospora morrowiae]|uniref:14503_t:CDS:1 n=1 Tax=Acaulospora morrowiae TaxID=94023 RepID=A0A9N9BRI9_9GLOM|nr:14503_t:CDS:2 [Acaulospora morrowiae]